MLRLASARIDRFHYLHKALEFCAAKLPNQLPDATGRHAERSEASTRLTAFPTLSSFNQAVPHNENLTQSLLCLAERSEASTRTYKRSIPSSCNRSVSQHYNMTTITTLVPLTILKSPLLPCGRGAPTPTPGPRTPGVRVLIHPSNASLTSFLRSAPILTVYAPLPALANLLITRSIYDDKDNWN